MRMDWERLLKPRYWIQNYKTNWDWDGILNDLLDKYEPEDVSPLTVRLGKVVVWVGNWPYAYGTAHFPSADVLPSVETRKRLRNRVPKKDELAEVRSVIEVL